MTANDALEARAPELLIQIVRTLRVAAVHDLDNDAARQVAGELLARLTEDLALFDGVALAMSNEAVYVNGEFVKLRGAAFDAALQARQLFLKLGINELRFVAAPDAAELRLLLSGVQACLRAPEPQQFARLTFPKVVLKPIEEHHRVGIDERVALARTYAQLVAILQESVIQLGRGKPLALARIRRALHELMRASERHRSLLVGLTRYDGAGGDPALHATGVGALVIAMCMELGVGKKTTVSVAQAALIHHLGDAAESVQTRGSKPPEAGSADAVVRLARAMPSVEVADRLSVVLEAAETETVEKGGVIPSTASRLVGVACAFDRLTRSAPPSPGLTPDEALRLLVQHAGARYDSRAVRLLISVVGLYPVGSMVRLNSGEVGVVLNAPLSGEDVARPTVRIVEAGGRPASYVVELSKRPELSVVACLDPRKERVNVVHLLLA